MTDENDDKEVGAIEVTSIVSSANGRPRVNVTAQTPDALHPLRWQWDPAEARQHAAQVLAAADAAESDAIIVRWLRTKMHADDNMVGAVLTDIRRMRMGD